jgi:hypothetical protein
VNDLYREHLGVGDPETFKLRILRKMCSTCIMRPVGERIALSNARISEFVREAVRADSYVVCHSTLPVAGSDVQPAICRGFADRYDTNALRVGQRLLGFVEVDPPAEKARAEQ